MYDIFYGYEVAKHRMPEKIEGHANENMQSEQKNTLRNNKKSEKY